MLLGSQEGLSISTIDKSGSNAALRMKVPELDLIKVQDIQPSTVDNTFWIATADHGVFGLVLSGDKYIITRFGLNYGLGNENVQSVFEDSGGQLWICTMDKGVLRLGSPDKEGNYLIVNWFNKQNGLPVNAVKEVFEDLEGNFWIATYGQGLSLLTSKIFAFNSFQNPGLENDILSIAVTDNKTYFLVGNQVFLNTKQVPINLL